jgi:hypothetical protein
VDVGSAEGLREELALGLAVPYEDLPALEKRHEPRALEVHDAGDDGLADPSRLDEVGEADRLDYIRVVRGAEVQEGDLLLVDARAGELQGADQLVGHAAAGEIAEGIARIGELGIYDRHRARRIARLEAMVVHDDDVDHELGRPRDLGVVRDAAIHGDHEGAARRGEFLDRGLREPVCLVRPGEPPRDVEAELLQGLGHEDGARHPVGVPIPEDEDLLPLVHGEEDAVDGVLHLGEEEGVVEVARIVLQIKQELLRLGDAAPGEDGGGEGIDSVAGGEVLDEEGRDFFFCPFHSSLISFRTRGAAAGLSALYVTADSTRGRAAASEASSLP